MEGVGDVLLHFFRAYITTVLFRSRLVIGCGPPRISTSLLHFTSRLTFNYNNLSPKFAIMEMPNGRESLSEERLKSMARHAIDFVPNENCDVSSPEKIK
jgi:hypothetical protein